MATLMLIRITESLPERTFPTSYQNYSKIALNAGAPSKSGMAAVPASHKPIHLFSGVESTLAKEGVASGPGKGCGHHCPREN